MLENNIKIENVESKLLKVMKEKDRIAFELKNLQDENALKAKEDAEKNTETKINFSFSEQMSF